MIDPVAVRVKTLGQGTGELCGGRRGGLGATSEAARPGEGRGDRGDGGRFLEGVLFFFESRSPTLARLKEMKQFFLGCSWEGRVGWQGEWKRMVIIIANSATLGVESPNKPL